MSLACARRGGRPVFSRTERCARSKGQNPPRTMSQPQKDSQGKSSGSALICVDEPLLPFRKLQQVQAEAPFDTLKRAPSWARSPNTCQSPQFEKDRFSGGSGRSNFSSTSGRGKNKTLTLASRLLSVQFILETQATRQSQSNVSTPFGVHVKPRSALASGQAASL